MLLRISIITSVCADMKATAALVFKGSLPSPFPEFLEDDLSEKLETFRTDRS